MPVIRSPLELEHDQRPRLARPFAGTARTPACRRTPPPARGASRWQPMPKLSSHFAIDVVPLEPELVRRHRQRRLLVQQRRERLDVVRARTPRRSARRAPAARRVSARGTTAGLRVSSVARARCSALFTAATLMSSASAVSAARPVEHLREQQHGALARRQVLQRGDEGEPDALAAGARAPRGRERRRRAARARRGSARPSARDCAAAAPCRASRRRGVSDASSGRMRCGSSLLSVSRQTFVAMR